VSYYCVYCGTKVPDEILKPEWTMGNWDHKPFKCPQCDMWNYVDAQYHYDKKRSEEQ